MSMICNLLDFPDAHIDELISNPESIRALIKEDEFTLRLDKAWHGIHFMLTGETWSGQEPLCYLVTGGETIGDIDVGWGPVRAVKSAQVAAFHEQLDSISETDFRSRFNPEKMEELNIYPGRWTKDSDGMLDYLLHYFEKLKTKVAEAKENQVGLLIWCN